MHDAQFGWEKMRLEAGHLHNFANFQRAWEARFLADGSGHGSGLEQHKGAQIIGSILTTEKGTELILGFEGDPSGIEGLLYNVTNTHRESRQGLERVGE
jgi:hypothetical protein